MLGKEAALATGMSTEDFAELNEKSEEKYQYQRESIEEMMSRPFDTQGE
jgi:hypothetical protein